VSLVSRYSTTLHNKICTWWDGILIKWSFTGRINKRKVVSIKSGRSRLRVVDAYERFQVKWFDWEHFGKVAANGMWSHIEVALYITPPLWRCSGVVVSRSGSWSEDQKFGDLRLGWCWFQGQETPLHFTLAAFFGTLFFPWKWSKNQPKKRKKNTYTECCSLTKCKATDKIWALWRKKSDPKCHLGHSCLEPSYIATTWPGVNVYQWQGAAGNPTMDWQSSCQGKCSYTY